MKELDSTQKIGLIIFIGLLALLTFKYLPGGNQQILKDFGLQRDKVMSEYVYDVVGFTPGMLSGKDTIPKCDQYSEFSADFSKDTRKMTVAELKQAISLYDSCHYDVTSQQYTIDGDFSSAISDLIGIGSKIKDT